ncbi:MAG: hypothetical protein IMZ60_04725 [Actinobacteria bacterium]|nr:hypothetical protein [Actinomycetota bacterium]
MKITSDKAFEMDRMFFALCDNCGSKVWYEDENVVNSLEDDGTQLIPRTVREFTMKFDATQYPRCYNCEKKISIILFKTIPKQERIQVAKMSAEKRKEWMLNLKIVKELEKEEWKNE